MTKKMLENINRVMVRVYEWEQGVVEAVNATERQQYLSRIRGARVALLLLGENEKESEIALIEGRLEKIYRMES